jgi:2-succinyl-5-enolpyruvyl-6-hydroxy-3-cyclohexene-1-carboxylate synthase
MYTTIKSVQILIALLKKHNIKHLVLSSGTRNIPLVHSVENDPFFTCYSVVDERSAAFFAMGISQELNVPVGISCTSSTATCNYLSAITEAFYQGVSLLVLTGDRDPYFLGQLEDQMIQQVGMYRDVCKKYVQLPIVNNDKDFWYCERLINEALLELDHRGRGPVHIDIPVPVSQEHTSFSVKCLPEVNAINRILLTDSGQALQNKISELKYAEKILIICGQNKLNDAEKEYIELFYKKYNCIISVEHLSNLKCEGTLNLSVLTQKMSVNAFEELLPDIVISFGGNIVSRLKNLLRYSYKKFKHWSINENGDLIDCFKSLTTIFECKSLHFFKYFAENADQELKNNKEYMNKWLEKYSQISIPEFPFSNIWIIQQFLMRIPTNALLHLSILNSIRLSEIFDIPSNIKVYANIGAFGIDGPMSTFFGQATVSSRLSFLIIGDLSFFYDMNSLRIKHIKNNVRILLINNHGGAEFYRNTGKKFDSSIDLHTAARHNTNAQGWVESVGLEYISAKTKEEYLIGLNKFIQEQSDISIVFEVFTEMEFDANTIISFYEKNSILTNRDRLVQGVKKTLRSVIGDNTYVNLKNNIKRNE